RAALYFSTTILVLLIIVFRCYFFLGDINMYINFFLLYGYDISFSNKIGRITTAYRATLTRQGMRQIIPIAAGNDSGIFMKIKWHMGNQRDLRFETRESEQGDSLDP
ncbi:hypothetical protein L9F63_019238, partial [Diploptera punctata]